MKDETKLIKKFYIERSWYSHTPSFAIVYGTAGKKEFMVKKREEIVGSGSDVRIALNQQNLFDDFNQAAEYFKRRCAEMRENIAKDLKYLDDGEKLVLELQKSLE